MGKVFKFQKILLASTFSFLYEENQVKMLQGYRKVKSIKTEEIKSGNNDNFT